MASLRRAFRPSLKSAPRTGPPTMKLADFKVLTFDCYGTLIDWETGSQNGLQPLVAKSHTASSRDRVHEIFAQHESAQEDETPSMPYSQLLSEYGIEGVSSSCADSC